MNVVTPIDRNEARDLYEAAGLKVTPAGPVLGAEISSIDLGRPLAPEG